MTNRAAGQLTAWLGIGVSALLLSTTPVAAENTPAKDTTIDFIQIQAGCFTMGTAQAGPTSRQGQPLGARLDELPQHQVCLDAFELATHEVTRVQWQQVLGGEPVESAEAQYPKGDISWQQAQRFIARLNQNQTTTGMHYRLPTEAEWEYACLAGGKAIHGVQLDTPEHLEQLKTLAWFNEPFRSEAQSRPVGQMPPNAWGLYDMLGNLWEWTADEYQAAGYSLHQNSNPLVDQGGEQRVIRGASYTSDRFLVRCGSRSYGLPDDPLPTQGLRLVRQATSN